ncbi:hypothetical protein [Rothia nasisuis]|uniref:hypothetical protein n=1 Tax=Rothia nasisuis TaxID=2109647 RepID=UPI001F4145B9|nr:hypothetical protein [Rothia nasisuis]
MKFYIILISIISYVAIIFLGGGVESSTANILVLSLATACTGAFLCPKKEGIGYIAIASILLIFGVLFNELIYTINIVLVVVASFSIWRLQVANRSHLYDEGSP